MRMYIPVMYTNQDNNHDAHLLAYYAQLRDIHMCVYRKLTFRDREVVLASALTVTTPLGAGVRT